MGVASKLGHVADALGKGDGGGASAKQARKPPGGLKARLVVVEGEEDPGAAPESRGHPLDPLGAQGGAGGEAPARKDKPVEDALGHHRKGRSGTEASKAKHRLGAGKRLEAGSPVGIDGPAHEPADKPAGDVGNDHHPGEPLRTPLGEQAGVPDAPLGEASRLKGVPQAKRPERSRGQAARRRQAQGPARPGTQARRDCAGAARRRTEPPPSRPPGPWGEAAAPAGAGPERDGRRRGKRPRQAARWPRAG